MSSLVGRAGRSAAAQGNRETSPRTGANAPYADSRGRERTAGDNRLEVTRIPSHLVSGRGGKADSRSRSRSAACSSSARRPRRMPRSATCSTRPSPRPATPTRWRSTNPPAASTSSTTAASLKYDAAGAASNFSALGTNAFTVPSCATSCREIAVDNSGGPNQGVIYVSKQITAANGGINVYLPSGTPATIIKNRTDTQTTRSAASPLTAPGTSTPRMPAATSTTRRSRDTSPRAGR